MMRNGSVPFATVVGQVLLAGIEPHEWSPPLRGLVAHRAAQRRMTRLECVQDRALGDRRVDLELHLSADAGQGAQVRRQHHPNHASV